MKPIGIVANLEKPQALPVARKLLGKLAGLREEVVLEEGLARLLKRKGGAPLQNMGSLCRLLVVLGGDGTVLRVARGIYPNEVPILPVNFGTLGFLAAVMPEELGKALMIALRNKGKIVPHSTLEVVLARHGKAPLRKVVLNDAVIARGTVSRVAELELRVDGEYLNTYVCDGMIFSSPTGSTAYSLSAGGPVLFPDARAYAITPICPHTLSNRSVIVGGDSVVETRIIRQPDEIFLGLDGQKMIRLNPKDRVLIKMSPYQVNMITMPGGSFFELLRKKLRWAGSSLPS
jgi:NAD+ kinase